MPNEIVRLVPNVGADVSLSASAYALDTDLDWGDHVIDPSLASGSDVVGGVPGVRRREPTDASIPIRIRKDTPGEYLAAAEALSDAVGRLSLYGGTITRQADFGDGDVSEELATTVYGCSLSPEEGWLQVHRLHSIAVLNVTRDPAWIATTAETLATLSGQSGGSIVLPFEARGSLPGPAALVASDEGSDARRYWEVGLAATQYQAADSYQYLAVSFTAGAASLGSAASDTAAIGGRALALSSVLPTPQVIGTLSDLTNVGTYNVKLRLKGSSEDAQAFVRVLWRQSGGGPWHEIGSVAVPGDASEYWMVEAGVLRNYAATTAPGVDTIDVRVDGYADVDGGATLSLDALFLIPAELHTVARGISIEQPPLENDIYDAWSDEETEGEIVDTTTAPAGGAWSIAGVATTPDWVARGAPSGGIRREGAGDSASGSLAGIGNGQLLVAGATPANDYTNTTATLRNCKVKHKGSVSTQTALGLVLRYNSNGGAVNGLMLATRAKRRADGKYKIVFSLYKFTGAGPTITKIKDLDQIDGRSVDLLLMSLSIDTSGVWNASIRWITGSGIAVPIDKSGTDTAFNSAPIDDGRVGIYSCIQSTNATYAFTEVGRIEGSSEASTPVESNVVRDDGIGTIDYRGARSDTVIGGDEVTAAELTGSRLWLPPGEGELVNIVRTSDSAVMPDAGYDEALGLELTHYPAWLTLADALE